MQKLFDSLETCAQQVRPVANRFVDPQLAEPADGLFTASHESPMDGACCHPPALPTGLTPMIVSE